ncbi:MAG: small ribosomal subunit Rsm22 family protein [Hyphomicrobiales bacterium]
MSHPLPAALKTAIEDFASGQVRAAIARRAAQISEQYRSGGASRQAITSPADVAAYLLARMPATFAAVSAALDAARRHMPSFEPASLLDLCAGPGTASFAALALWPKLGALTLIDVNPLLLDAARRLGEAGAMPMRGKARLICSELGSAFGRLPRADLVVMSYALVELPESEIAELARRIRSLAAGLALFVEPGTPEGFRRILLCRDALIEAQANIIAPCPHSLACPMQPPQWCHFSERLPRSRDHRLVKGASLPFEDEPYCYLAVGRQPAEIGAEARIVSRVRVSKVEASCRVCAADGRLADRTVPRREREAYAGMRRAAWGDAVVGEWRIANSE